MQRPVAEIIRSFGDYLKAASSDPTRSRISQLRGQGPIQEFEHRLSEIVGKRFCLATNNATNGLLALALAVRLSREEIITTPKTYGATWGPFLLLKNKLRFAQCDKNGNINPTSVERLIRKSTRAVVAVDYQGVPHDSATLRAICSGRGILYLADAAQSFGRYLPNGRHASALADALVLSFGPGKVLDCGEGGAILTDEECIYRECLRLCQHPERYRFEYSLLDATEIQPINARIHPVAALIGLVQLSTLTGGTPLTYDVPSP
jgi:dTDP-4-amino-4,6-dideoxygalactose transaminase